MTEIAAGSNRYCTLRTRKSCGDSHVAHEVSTDYSVSMSKSLLIICHTPSKNTRSLAHAILRGANNPELNVEVTCLSPFQTDHNHVQQADAIILGTTENFGYMSGALKDFFDRIYYPCLENTQGMPYSLMVRAGLDGTGTINAVEKIIAGLKWKTVQAPLLCKGEYTVKFEEQCEELGLTIAAGLDAGIF